MITLKSYHWHLILMIMMKIRVSYIKDQELQEVIKLLQPKLRNVKVAKNEQGAYKKAYIELKD